MLNNCFGEPGDTCTCGNCLPIVDNNFPHATDGTFTLVGLTVDANLSDTELTETPKDVLVIVTHGLCGVNGATPAIIKKGKMGRIITNHDGLPSPGPPDLIIDHTNLG